jgi:hypothetical protein
VNVERTTTDDGGQVMHLTVSTPEGLTRVDLADVRDLRFEREALRADLEAALAALAASRDGDANVVRLRFEGEGERRVRVGYVREMPVWKPSYRLVLRDDGRADLQGWAIFDNPTHLDLVDVEIAFVAGRPISFISELFEPVYVERRRVGPVGGRRVRAAGRRGRLRVVRRCGRSRPHRPRRPWRTRSSRHPSSRAPA